MNIHLLNWDGKAVGCGWQPTASKALDLHPDDYSQEPHKYAQCTRCFKNHDFPTNLGSAMRVENVETSDLDSDALSSDLVSDDANDTASEYEKATAAALKNHYGGHRGKDLNLSGSLWHRPTGL